MPASSISRYRDASAPSRPRFSSSASYMAAASSGLPNVFAHAEAIWASLS